jgi:hypothetical protein
LCIVILPSSSYCHGIVLVDLRADSHRYDDAFDAAGEEGWVSLGGECQPKSQIPGKAGPGKAGHPTC